MIKISEISDLINIRNYILLQIENPRTEKKVSFKLIKVLADLDKQINESILDKFLEKNES